MSGSADSGMRVRVLMRQTPLGMNTGRVTTSAPGVLSRWTRIAGYVVMALVAVYGF
jgi:hypothetical protein